MRCPSYPQFHQQQKYRKAEKLAPQFATVSQGHYGGLEFLSGIEETHPRSAEDLGDNAAVDLFEVRLSRIDVYRKLIQSFTADFNGPDPGALQVGYRPKQTALALQRFQQKAFASG